VFAEVNLGGNRMRFGLLALARRSFCTRTVVASLATASLLVTQAHGQTEVEPKRVMMLHSFGLRFKPWVDYSQTLRSEINRQSKRAVRFDDHSLLNARLGQDKSDAPFVDYLHTIYAEKPPDLIIALGAPAANFVQRYRPQLFPGTPMLFTAVEARRVQYDKLTENDTVAAAAHDFPAAFELILQVLPRTKTIAIVNGVSPNEAFWRGVLNRELEPLSRRVTLKWYDDLPFEEMVKDAANLPPDSAIFWHLLSVDAAGYAHEGNAALDRLSAAANAPIFSYLDVWFGESILGGSMQSALEGSVVAAAAAIRILDGEKAGDVKIPPTHFTPPRFDWRQMQRFGIRESNLPAGSTVYFREQTVWERYSWQIALTAAIILLQAALISALLLEHRRRQFAEVQSRQRMAELAHVNRFSTAGELTASIAHEINQPLGAILTNAETAQAMLKSPKPDLAELSEILGDILRDDRRVNEVIQRMRSLLKKAPFEQKQFDLNEVVQETIRFLSALAVSRKFELDSLITSKALPILGDRIQLQQVILNLVVNGIDAMKDTPVANRVISIRSSRFENFAELSVSDLGTGIPEDKLHKVFEPFFTTKAEGMGMGLSIVRTIIEAHHGQMSAINRDHGGATFRIRLPLCTDGAAPLTRT
jgi:signal transduction histidine kinase